MPTLLGPTNPVPEYEPQPVKITTPPANDQTVSNIVNPQQVVRPDGRTDQQDTGDATQSFAARYESNFMTFLQRLRGMPNVTDTLLRLFQGQSMYVTSGIRSGFSQEIAQFLEFLQMDEGTLLSFLKNQTQGGARFSGPLFDALRQAYSSTTSDVLKNDILQFLRRYSDFTSTPHLEDKILRTVSDMTTALPARWADKLTQILAQLENGVASASRFQNQTGGSVQTRADDSFANQLGDLLRYQTGDAGEALPGDAVKNPATGQADGQLASLLQGQFAAQAGEGRTKGLFGDPLAELLRSPSQTGASPPGDLAGDRAGNLRLLRNQVFPLISQYVSLTHDHGRARGLLSMLALDVARYENGDPKGLVQAFRHLAANNALPEKLQDLSTEEVLRLLEGTNFSKASRNDAFADRLAKSIDTAVQGKSGVEAQEAFRNVLSSLILNESVYMPLNHVMIPLVWNGRLMFSEMWMDPDAEKTEREREEERRRGGGMDSGGRTMRILLKMDIQDRGAFDVLINKKDNDVSLHVACPQGYAPFTEEMAKALSQILERNNLRAADVAVAQMRRPVAVSEVFPKLFERMRGVNVKI